VKNVLSLEQFKACASILAASTGRAMPQEQAESYLILLQDIPFEILRAACIRSVQQMNANFVPAVGAIREIAAELQYGSMPQAATEWQRVMQACSSFGFIGQRKAAAELGELTWGIVSEMGWQSICQTEQPDISRAQFVRLFDQRAAMHAIQRRISPELRTGIVGNTLKAIGGTNG
jgi:hypothetical protein